VKINRPTRRIFAGRASTSVPWRSIRRFQMASSALPVVDVIEMVGVSGSVPRKGYLRKKETFQANAPGVSPV